MNHQEIPGWLAASEAAELAKLAANARVLEIGSYQGRSTIVMAQVAELVVAVDHHQGDSGCDGGNLSAFLKNLERYGVRDKVIPVVADSVAACAVMMNGYFDLVFVDGDHEYEAVIRDIQAVKRVVKQGGTLAFHDADYTSVHDAIVESGLPVGYVRGRTRFIRQFDISSP